MFLSTEPAPITGSCGERIIALPWAPAPSCHQPMIPVPALAPAPAPATSPAPRHWFPPACTPIPSTWSNAPCSCGSWVCPHGDPTHPLHPVSPAVGVGCLNWSACGSGYGSRLAVAARSHRCGGCQEVSLAWDHTHWSHCIPWFAHQASGFSSCSFPQGLHTWLVHKTHPQL